MPIDPVHPVAYCKDLLLRTGASLLVLDDGTVFDAPGKVTALEYSKLHSCDVPFTPQEHFESDLAFLFFTSGSTGVPKIVKTSHLGRISSVLWLAETFADGASHLFKSSISHNPMIREVFWPLLTGARIVVPDDDERNDVLSWKRLIDTYDISVVGFTPSTLTVFLKNVTEGDCQALRHIVCGGEPLKSSTQSAFFDKLPHVDLLRFYGLTEAGMALYRCLEKDDPPGILGIPTYLRVELLDESFIPVDQGDTGEIVISGDGVSDGYLGDDTHPSFTSHPFRPSTKAFRTGDYATQDPDGVFLFVGRRDRMVKIRGQRIELDEVEKHVSEVPGVRSAVADVFGDSLVCFYTVSPDVAVAATDDSIIRAMRTTVRSALVPNRLIRLSDIPLAANGKIDFRKLRECATQLVARTDSSGTPTESLDEMITRLTGVEQPNDNQRFYTDLGGDSLLVIELRAAIHRVFGVDLTSEAFASDFTIADLRERLARGKSKVATTFGHTIRTRRSDRPGSLTANQLQAMQRGGRTVIKAFVARGGIDFKSFDRAIGEFETRHAVGSIRIIRDDRGTGEVRQVRTERRDHLRFTKLAGSEQDCLAAAMIVCTDFVKDETELPYRVLAVAVSDTLTLLVFCFDSMFFDGFSIRLFFREVSAAYNHLLHNAHSDSNGKTYSIIEYARWENSVLSNGASLSDIQERLARSPSLSFVGGSEECDSELGSQRHVISRATKNKLTSVAREVGISRERLLLGGIAFAIGKKFQSPIVPLHVMANNRVLTGTQELIAPLATRVPLVFDFRQPCSFAQRTRLATSVLDTFQPPLGWIQRAFGDDSVFKSPVLIFHAVEGEGQLRLGDCSISALAKQSSNEDFALDGFTDLMITVRRAHGEHVLNCVFRKCRVTNIEIRQMLADLEDSPSAFSLR